MTKPFDDMEGWIADETNQPIQVHIVRDSSARHTKHTHLDTRRIVIPEHGFQGQIGIQAAGHHRKRGRMLLGADVNNVGVIYLSDSPLKREDDLDNIYGLAPGHQLETWNTHQVFVWGNMPGDICYVWEETTD